MSDRTADPRLKYWANPDTYGVAAYLERPDKRPNLVDRFVASAWGGLRARRVPRRVAAGFPKAVEAAGEALIDLDEAGFRARTDALRPALLRHGFREDLKIEAFALVREATRRTLGISQRPVQIHGASLLIDGFLLEMATGEGKTITAALAAGVAALAGLRVHVVTVNEYLAERDYEELKPIHELLGLRVGLVINRVETPERRQAYGADIVYVDNKEVTFDYLRDRLSLGQRRSRARSRLTASIGGGAGVEIAQELTMRGLDFAIVDEADSVLIDEAKTPLIISAENAAPEGPAEYLRGLDIARALLRGRDYELSEKDRSVRLTDAGRERVAHLASPYDGIWRVRRAREERVTQALSALLLYRLDEHYILAGDKVQIVDEYTGRVMPDRSWEAGLHQMIEAKEGMPLTGRRSTIARITYQRFFRRYRRLSGMTGTGQEVAGELAAEFDLRTRRVPTHRPLQRRFLGTRMLPSAAAKWPVVVAAVRDMVAMGRPVLVGVRSVKDSQTLSDALTAAGVGNVVLNARQDAQEAAIVAQAGQAGQVTVATNMAGRGTDIKLGPGVLEAGGLHVILTEFHESPRIDRQLYGRAGRQGDPGSCEAIVALDDEIFANHAALLHRLIRRVPMLAAPAGGRVAAAVLRRVAQRRAEAANAEIRRLNLKLDRDLAKALAFAGRPE